MPPGKLYIGEFEDFLNIVQGGRRFVEFVLRFVDFVMDAFWSLFGLISYCLFDLNLLVCVVRHSNLDEQTCWFCYTCWVERVCTKMRSSINIKGTFALLASHSLLEEEEGNITRKFKTDTLLTCCKEWISRKKIKSSINVFSKQARKGVLS